MPSSLFLFALGVSIAVWVTNWVRRRDKLPEGIPLVRFEDGEDSYQRYLKDSRTVVKQGYNKVRYICFISHQKASYMQDVDWFPAFSV